MNTAPSGAPASSSHLATLVAARARAASRPSMSRASRMRERVKRRVQPRPVPQPFRVLRVRTRAPTVVVSFSPSISPRHLCAPSYSASAAAGSPRPRAPYRDIDLQRPAPALGDLDPAAAATSCLPAPAPFLCGRAAIKRGGSSASPPSARAPRRTGKIVLPGPAPGEQIGLEPGLSGSVSRGTQIRGAPHAAAQPSLRRRGVSPCSRSASSSRPAPRARSRRHPPLLGLAGATSPGPARRSGPIRALLAGRWRPPLPAPPLFLDSESIMTAAHQVTQP